MCYDPVQGRVNIAGLAAVLSEDRTGPWLASGNWISRGLPPLSELIPAAHAAWTVCTNNVVYVEHLTSFCESGILAGARQTVPMWLTLRSTPWTPRPRRAPLVDSISHALSQPHAGGFSASYVAPVGGDPPKPMPGFFQASLREPFPLCQSCLVGINYSHKYDLCRVLWGHWVSRAIQPGGGLGDPNTDPVINSWVPAWLTWVPWGRVSASQPGLWTRGCPHGMMLM